MRDTPYGGGRVPACHINCVPLLRAWHYMLFFRGLYGICSNRVHLKKEKSKGNVSMCKSGILEARCRWLVEKTEKMHFSPTSKRRIRRRIGGRISGKRCFTRRNGAETPGTQTSRTLCDDRLWFNSSMQGFLELVPCALSPAMSGFRAFPSPRHPASLSPSPHSEACTPAHPLKIF